MKEAIKAGKNKDDWKTEELKLYENDKILQQAYSKLFDDAWVKAQAQIDNDTGKGDKTDAQKETEAFDKVVVGEIIRGQDVPRILG